MEPTLPTYIVTSDLHGSAGALSLLVAKAKAVQAAAILVAGDLVPQENPTFRQLLLEAPLVYLVRGNCDSSYAFHQAGLTLPPLLLRLPWGSRTILMTHGDQLPYSEELNLQKGDLFISGHTHLPRLQETSGGILLVNPGSPTYPRTALGPTYAILDADGVSIRTFDDDRPIPLLQYYFPFTSDQ